MTSLALLPHMPTLFVTSLALLSLVHDSIDKGCLTLHNAGLALKRGGGGGGVGRELYLTLCKLQALVYDILHSTTAVFSYAIGSRKLSANEQFLFFVFLFCFVGAQTVVSLLTTQIISDVCFMLPCCYASSDKTKIV